MKQDETNQAVHTNSNLGEIELLTIEQLNTHPELEMFYVASYQRGYRWGEKQVEYFLNDINGIASDKKYCIQPLTVLKKENKTWELIDGQQRTTTIFLIQSVLKNCFSIPSESVYALDYNTRLSTKEFLNEIMGDNILEEFLGENFENEWVRFINNNIEKDNIDNYHLFKAHHIIYNWLNGKQSNERKAFYKKLQKQTYVIWHPITIVEEAVGTQTVEDLFLNMNAGKIKLTSAELIKALFIIAIEKSNDPWDIRESKKKKLADEWDTIENELHNNTFWYFINNEDKQVYSTRIGKLFDLHCKKPKGESDLYSYYSYTKGEYNGGKKLDWAEIKQIFQRLKEWYEDVESFHLIGFIINTRIKTLEELINETEGETKLRVKDIFIETIKTNFAKKKENQLVYSLDNLSYNTSKEECTNTLLLYNIKLIEKLFPNQRFPFDLYQNKDTKWSIEHIHPQNPEQLKSKEEAIEWLSDYEKRYKEDEDIEGDNYIRITEIQQQLQSQDSSTLSKSLSVQLKEFSDLVSEELGLHQIGNQALLDKNTNSKIGNKSFLKKRNLILEELDNPTGSYIPLATIHNFLKKTTKPDKDNSIKMSYWSTQDAEDYTNDIERLLKDFLPKKNIRS